MKKLITLLLCTALLLTGCAEFDSISNAEKIINERYEGAEITVNDRTDEFGQIKFSCVSAQSPDVPFTFSMSKDVVTQKWEYGLDTWGEEFAYTFVNATKLPIWKDNAFQVKDYTDFTRVVEAVTKATTFITSESPFTTQGLAGLLPIQFTQKELSKFYVAGYYLTPKENDPQFHLEYVCDEYVALLIDLGLEDKTVPQELVDAKLKSKPGVATLTAEGHTASVDVYRNRPWLTFKQTMELLDKAGYAVTGTVDRFIFVIDGKAIEMGNDVITDTGMYHATVDGVPQTNTAEDGSYVETLLTFEPQVYTEALASMVKGKVEFVPSILSETEIK